MHTEVRKIGIGIGSDAEKVINSACRVSIPYDIICYMRPGMAKIPAGHMNVSALESETPETALVSDLMSGTISAAVRGTLPANATLQALRNAARVRYLERIALLETAGEKKFLLAPVGIDEGWTVAESFR